MAIWPEPIPPAPGASAFLVHFGEVLGISPREDHLAKAIAVGTGKSAVFVEPLVAIVREHLGPQVGVVAGAVSALPDVAEVSGAIAWRHVTHVEVGLLERLLLELVGVLERAAGRKEVPLHVEFGAG